MPSTFWPSCLPEAELFAQGSDERRQAGQEHFTEVFLAMLQSVSHPQLSALADWACNGTGTLHTSQISLLRNNKMRMLGTKTIDALGRLNQAAWAAMHHPELLPRLGCAPLTEKIEKILASYQPLLDPCSQEPLGSGALLEIYLGLRRIPIAMPRSLQIHEAEQLAERLVDWLEGELRAMDLSVREAGKRLQQAWAGEGAGGKRLVRALAGLEDYTAKQIAEGWHQIATTVLTVLDREVDVWALADALLTPPAAAAELNDLPGFEAMAEAMEQDPPTPPAQTSTAKRSRAKPPAAATSQPAKPSKGSGGTSKRRRQPAGGTAGLPSKGKPQRSA